uniref:DUF3276 family protein n=1 Tax=Strongyloides venezuelensis TaxID=75913 RepID=A0A0K0FRH9_STRVS
MTPKKSKAPKYEDEYFHEKVTVLSNHTSGIEKYDVKIPFSIWVQELKDRMKLDSLDKSKWLSVLKINLDMQSKLYLGNLEDREKDTFEKVV